MHRAIKLINDQASNINCLNGAVKFENEDRDFKLPDRRRRPKSSLHLQRASTNNVLGLEHERSSSDKFDNTQFVNWDSKSQVVISNQRRKTDENIKKKINKCQFKLDGGEPESEANTFKERYLFERKRAKTPNLEVRREYKSALNTLVSKELVTSLETNF